MEHQNQLEKACGGGSVCRLRLFATLDSADGGDVDITTSVCIPAVCGSGYQSALVAYMERTICPYYKAETTCRLALNCGIETGRITLIIIGIAFVVFVAAAILARYLYKRMYDEDKRR